MTNHSFIICKRKFAASTDFNITSAKCNHSLNQKFPTCVLLYEFCKNIHNVNQSMKRKQESKWLTSVCRLWNRYRPVASSVRISRYWQGNSCMSWKRRFVSASLPWISRPRPSSGRCTRVWATRIAWKKKVRSYLFSNWKSTLRIYPQFA